jgi:integrase
MTDHEPDRRHNLRLSTRSAVRVVDCSEHRQAGMEGRLLGWEAASSANELRDEGGKVRRVVPDQPMENQFVLRSSTRHRICQQVERLWRWREFAELLRVAAYTGLRRGELVALRWRDVRWSEHVLVVERALSGDTEGTTKGGRVRYVPLGDQALAALDRLSRHPNLVRADDYVFGNVTGDRLDPSALRRRFVAARDAAGLPPLRFHDLRHTAGTLLTRVLDPVTVRDVLGHADLKTTQRYLHAVRASRLSDAATQAFTPDTDDARGAAAKTALRAAAEKLGADEARRILESVR